MSIYLLEGGFGLIGQTQARGFSYPTLRPMKVPIESSPWSGLCSAADSAPSRVEGTMATYSFACLCLSQCRCYICNPFTRVHHTCASHKCHTHVAFTFVTLIYMCLSHIHAHHMYISYRSVHYICVSFNNAPMHSCKYFMSPVIIVPPHRSTLIDMERMRAQLCQIILER